MLSEIIQAFESRNPGVASFATFAADCQAAMEKDKANAAVFVMLALAARQFHDRFADQPLTVEAAKDAKQQMLALAQAAGDALGGTADAKLGVLNDIALKNFTGR